MRKSPLIAALAVIASLTDGGAAGADVPIGYTAKNIGALSGASGPTVANAINGAGQIVGSSPVAAGDQHAFIYSGGTMVDLGTLGGASSAAFGVNSIGQTVGSSTTSSGDQHAFLYNNNVMTDLGTLGGATSVAQGINASGEIVGSSTVASGAQVGFSYSNGMMTAINYNGAFFNGNDQVAAYAINSQGDVLVDTNQFDGLATHYLVLLIHNAVDDFLSDPTAGSPICTGLATGVTFYIPSEFFGYALNDAGQAVGFYDECPTSAGVNSVWTSDAMIAATLPHAQDPSRALGINNSNMVVGELTSPSGLHAFVTSPLIGPLDLNAVTVPGVLTLGEVLTSAPAINDAGTIVAVSNLGRAYSLVPSAWAAGFVPANLSFGNQAVNAASATQSATFTNSAGLTVNVASVVASPNFSQTNDCGSSLAAGAACTIKVAFAPTVTGTLNGLVAVTAGGVPYHVATMTGVGTLSLTLTASGMNTTTGVPITLTWNASSGATCTATGGGSGDGWAGSYPATGSRAISETTPGTYTYSLECEENGTAEALSQAVVTVTAAPVVTLSAAANMVSVGQPVSLTWTSAHATSCVAGGGSSGDGWPGSKALSGTALVTESSTGTFTYTVNCISGPTSVQALVHVTDSNPPSSGGGGALNFASLLSLGALVLIRARRSRSRIRPSTTHGAHFIPAPS